MEQATARAAAAAAAAAAKTTKVAASLDTRPWPIVFYVAAAMGFVWVALWWVLGMWTRETIACEDGSSGGGVGGSGGSGSATRLGGRVAEVARMTHGGIPWRTLLASPPFLAVAAGHFASNWGQVGWLASLSVRANWPACGSAVCLFGDNPERD